MARSLVSPQAAPTPTKQKSKRLLNFGGGGEKCQACGKTAYQAERAQIGNYYFHVNCLRCAVCGPSRHLGSDYGLAANADGVITLYCSAHEAEAKSKYPQTGATQVTAERTGVAVLPAAAAKAMPAAVPAAVSAAVPAAIPAAIPAGIPTPPSEASARAASPPTEATAGSGATHDATHDATSIAVPKVVPAGLGTAADRALEESLKNSARAHAPSAAAQEAQDANPFARCLQCWV